MQRRTLLKASICAFACSLFMVGALSASAFAADGTTATTFTSGDVTYAVTSNNTVSVGTGNVGEQAISTSYSGRLSIPSTVSNKGTVYTVTAIAPYACTACTGLTSVSIPASVTSIGYNAFGYCGSMDDSGSTPIYSGLQTISIASNSQLNIIGENAFVKDYALKSFTIPAAVESIGQRAFQDCFSFEELKCEEGSQLKGIATRAFAASLPAMDPDTVQNSSKGPGTFKTQSVSAQNSTKQYSHLKSVSLPASIKTLGDGAFENQRALTSLSWTDGTEATVIGDYCFQYCTSLEVASVPAVTFAPEGLGPYSFQYCVNLKTFIYKGVIRAPYSGYSERGLFRGVTSLETVIYLANKYHQPHGTLTTLDTGRLTFTSCNPTVYYLVKFYSSKSDAENGGTPIGQAVIREGTTFANIKSSMAASDSSGCIIYSGSVPSISSGYGWAGSYGGGAVGLSNATSVWPASKSDLSGGGIALSKTEFSYTAAECKPAVTVQDSTGSVLDSSQYTLVWEREKDDGSWALTTDFTSAGTLRVSAKATSGQYSGSTQPVEFTITSLEEDDTFTEDGITYTVLTAADSSNPTVMVGDGYDLAVDKDTAGALEIPGAVTPTGSNVTYKVVEIAANAFGGSEASSACTGISSIMIGEGVKRIDAAAFRYMSSLQSVSLPSTLESIGANAFANCESLESITFAGSSMASIGLKAFANCQSLESIELPELTDSFASFAFQNCGSLSHIVFKGDVKTSASNQFQGCDYIDTAVFYGAVPSCTLPSNTNRYAHVEFQDEHGAQLGSADIAIGTATSNVKSSMSASSILNGSVPSLPAKSIGWSFASQGTKLSCGTVATAMSATYTLGSGQSKAVYAVGNLSKHTVVYKTCKSTAKSAAQIPATVIINGTSYTVTKVAANAFKNSKNVKTVTVKSTRITSFAKAFANSSVGKVKVPKSKKSAYKKLLTKKACGRSVKVM